VIDGNDTVIEKEEDEEVEGSIYSFGEFSSTARVNYTFKEDDKPRHRGDTRHTTTMSSNKEQGDRDGRSTVSDDSGRGKTPEAGISDFLRFYVEDQRRQREEQHKREEKSRQVQREETAWRDEESRRAMDAQQCLLEAMMARRCEMYIPQHQL